MQSFLQLQVWEQLNEEKLRKDLEAVLAQGITSLAVVLLHSYTCVTLINPFPSTGTMNHVIWFDVTGLASTREWWGTLPGRWGSDMSPSRPMSCQWSRLYREGSQVGVAVMS